MQMTRTICRTEDAVRRFRFVGYAASGAENTVRPRAVYRACTSCSTTVLTLGDVDDALALCRSVLERWMRTGGRFADRIDVDNVLGDMYAHVWHLYGKWNPRELTFTSYATGILRKKINTFVSVDVGDPRDVGRPPKAHSRTLSESYEVVSVARYGESASGSREEIGGLDFALGAVAQDPTGDLVASRSWVASLGDRAGYGLESG